MIMQRGARAVRTPVVPLLLAGLLVATVATTATTATAATPPTDLYVGHTAGCSDTGAGTVTKPFCTVDAAAAVALPGQTVHIVPGAGVGPLDVTRSGEPGSPITFLGITSASDSQASFVQDADITGVHDVVLTGLHVSGASTAVTVTDSSSVVIDDNELDSDGFSQGYGVAVTGRSSGVTVSRNRIWGYGSAGIDVGGGAAGTTVTTNLVTAPTTPTVGPLGVVVTDAPSTAVTGNTVTVGAVQGIQVRDGSNGSTVENNIVRNAVSPDGSCGCAELEVTSDSASGTVVDYNLLAPVAGNPPYTWAGVQYQSPAAFTAATGQGGHDIDADPRFSVTSVTTPGPGSPAIDSADTDAPGELSTDVDKLPRVDDPAVPNTGTGVADRGAQEEPDPFSFTFTTTPYQGPLPLTVTIAVTPTNPWSTSMSYAVDFGDGSAPVVASGLTASHPYTTKPASGQYTVKVTATAPDGQQYQRQSTVRIVDPAPLVPDLRVAQVGPMTVLVDASGSTDSWDIDQYVIDFGDGSSPTRGTGSRTNHFYVPGTYTVKMTETDAGGNTATLSRRVTVAGAYNAVDPTRLLDTRHGIGVRTGRVGPGGVVRVKVPGAGPGSGFTAVVLNVTAVNPTASSYLAVYPDGGQRPVVSNLNFVAGQTVPNLVTVPVGANGYVDFYNHVGTVDVLADEQGDYEDSPSSGLGSFLTTVQPQRVLDTRNGTGYVRTSPVGPGGSLLVHIPEPPGGGGYAVLNVTVTNPTSASYLTVYDDENGLAVRPITSNLNFSRGETTSNLVIVPVGGSSSLVFYNYAGSVDVIADIEGYYINSADSGVPTDITTSSFTPTTPTRLLDTRSHNGPVGANGSVSVQVAGAGGIPAGATAAVLNVTAVGPTTATYVTAYADGTTRPATSTLNVGAGQTVPNLVVVPIGADGRVDLYNHSGRVDLLADVQGYFMP